MIGDGPICVTGATGYVAGHVVRELLERGATVRATARDPSNRDKVGHLVRMAEASPGSLELFAADLLVPGSFDEAVAGCAVVVHTASPFVIGKVSDPQRDLVDPAVQGTTTVLDAVDRSPSVRRVVLTSSVAAIHGTNREVVDRGGAFTEAHWNETSTLASNPYYLSKTLAERAAWERAEAAGRWELAVLNPGFVMGPSLTARNDSASIDFLLSMIDGRLAAGIWDQPAGWVDVRDVGAAHAEAALREGVRGRHILVSEVAGFWTVRQWLAEDFPGVLRLPRMRVPKWLAYAVGPPMGYGWSYVRDQLGWPLAYDNARSREALGLAYRPLRRTLRDHVQQLLDDGLYAPA